MSETWFYFSLFRSLSTFFFCVSHSSILWCSQLWAKFLPALKEAAKPRAIFCPAWKLFSSSATARDGPSVSVALCLLHPPPCPFHQQGLLHISTRVMSYIMNRAVSEEQGSHFLGIHNRHKTHESQQLLPGHDRKY